MVKYQYLAVSLLILLGLSAPALACAEHAAKKEAGTTYNFNQKKQAPAPAEEASAADTTPANIEPAAGGDEADAPTQDEAPQHRLPLTTDEARGATY